MAFCRMAILKDLPAIIRIDMEAFDLPFARQEWDWLFNSREHVISVAEVDEQVIGYSVICVVPGEFRILKVAAHREYRRLGIGKQIVTRLQERLQNRRPRKLVACVRECNLPGQLFYKAMGFRCVDTFPRLFKDGEDAYVFEYKRPKQDADGFYQLGRLVGIQVK